MFSRFRPSASFKIIMASLIGALASHKNIIELPTSRAREELWR